jgi:uncharacterized protein (DUF58 family)
MIVPSGRLMRLTALVLVPAAAMATALPSTAAGWAAVIFLVMVLGDALLGARSSAGIGLDLPETVRLTEEREGKIDLNLTYDLEKPKNIRLGLVLPPSIRSSSPDLRVQLPAGSGTARLQWPCRPHKRGSHTLHRGVIEATTPLGLWNRRGVMSLDSEIRVYPDLLRERQSVGGLFLKGGRFGIHSQRQVGKGREFEQLREYSPGDSYEDIHWKATAKRGSPITKVFQVERTQEIYTVIDTSRLSARPSHLDPWENGSTGSPDRHKTILDRFVTASIILAMAAERQGDLFGILNFADRVGGFLRAKSGRQHSTSCLDTLYHLQPRMVSPDFDELATFIRLRLRRRSLLIFLTSLDDPAVSESFLRNVDMFCRQHLVLVVSLKPTYLMPLFSGPEPASTDEIYRRLAGHIRWHEARELEKVLQRRGVIFSRMENEKLCPELVSTYLNVKKRQLL